MPVLLTKISPLGTSCHRPDCLYGCINVKSVQSVGSYYIGISQCMVQETESYLYTWRISGNLSGSSKYQRGSVPDMPVIETHSLTHFPKNRVT